MSYTVVKNYLSTQEAESVIHYLNGIFRVNPARGIKRFGLTNSYASNKESDRIPEALQYLVDKLTHDGYIEDVKHVTVNRYDPGQLIQYHTDNKEAGEIITVLSLNNDAVMLFKDDKNKVIKVPLPASSLLQFSEEHRWKMKHSIEPVAAMRYSIVFRKH